MSATSLALVMYIVWTVLLIFMLVGCRAMLVIAENRSVKFNADGSDVGQRGLRITRAHANCVESSVIIVGTLLLAIALQQQAVTDPLAYTLIACRVVQSLVHISSGAVWAIAIRGVAFLAQLVICLYWLAMMAGVS
ncbi:MAPEG family protein [Alteromonas halophila]|uniref:MAPEG family protein n=1 Tax=Alteromonas halophila TaxID=516698 RepID=A0A918JLD4_9ALTE|nr:MAPEG family protein [Alteromonas halophila]GGW83324.1 hypothetical protein GCM10007391_15940 [Alteromonas halophila]